MAFKIASMRDAAHLLDEPDFASRFLEADMAPYGVELWPSAIMLAEYITRYENGPHHAMELGCGLGLVTMVAAKLGWSIVAGDHEPSALVFARHNAELNNVEGLEFQCLDWNQPPDSQRFARVLGADILYQLNNHAPILKCLHRLLETDGMALIADPNRGVADRFPDLASDAGLRVEIVPAKAPGIAGQIQEGRIFRVFRP